MIDARTKPAPTDSAAWVATAHGQAIRLARHVLRMTTAAGSGHPSTALALCHITGELVFRQMRHDPADPWHRGNDRLVLSVGHGVPVIYAAWAELGGAIGLNRDHARALTVEDLARLRELESELDGHPNPAEGFPFFDAATGSLGQGLSVAAGLALAARLDGIDKRIFVIAGDGESREGQVWEAADMIVDHHLRNVCVVFSCNGHGQADAVSTQQSADAIASKMRAFGWHVVEVDGHAPAELSAAFDQAGRHDKPVAVVARTVKGWGVDLMLGKNFHGKPLTPTELNQALDQLDTTARQLGADIEPSVRTPVGPSKVAPSRVAPPIKLPPMSEALKRVGLAAALEKKKLATRAAYGAALVALGDADERIVSLDGDVSNSTFANYFAREHSNRFFECKIAEQNMVTTAAGMAAAGKIPFASSFAKFIARAVDQIDMAGISRANVKIVGSHAGVSLGADGPSQMAVSDVAYFRSMTRVDTGRSAMACHVFHPCDAVSAYRCCELMANIDGLCYLRTHRPDAPFVYPLDEAFALYGCKQLRTGTRVTLVSAGYMVHSALQAATLLEREGVSCHVFDAYTFPLDPAPILAAARAAGGTILTIEDNYAGGLHSELAEAAAEFAEVRVIGMTVRRIPKSAKTAEAVFTYVGVGLEQIVDRARQLAGR